MKTPLQIAGPDFHLTESIKAEIQERAAKLEHFNSHIVSCRVAVEAPVHHHRKGGPFNIRIDLVVPSHELVATHQNGETLSIALREAFEAMERQLIDCSRVQASEYKHKNRPPRGQITRIFPEQGYGFIATEDGREVYFHQNSVMEMGFDKIAIGTEVWFSEEDGVQGTQASTVHIVLSPGKEGSN